MGSDTTISRKGLALIGDLMLMPLDSAHHALGVGHQTSLVLLSLLVAMGCSTGAFYMAAAHRRSQSALHRHISELCSCAVLGFGVWSMHFIGMLAMQWPVPVVYNHWITTVSMVPSVLAAWLALRTMRTPNVTVLHIITSGTLVGIGIATMHYSGVMAIDIPASILFAPSWVAASAVTGIAGGIAAFYLQMRTYRDIPPWKNMRALVLPPLLLTVGIASMHYLSMMGMRVVPAANAGDVPLDLGGEGALAVQIGTSALLLMVLLGLANAMLRYRDLWQAVAARDARLVAMVDTAQDGVISMGAYGLIQEFNPAAERIFGWTRDEVLHRNVSMLMPAPLAEQHDAFLAPHRHQSDRAIANNGREVLGQHKDGHLIPLKISIGKAQTPRGTLFVAYVADISQRKRAETQLRIAASVFEHVREGVAIVDANHNISSINSAFSRLLDVGASACAGQSLEALYEQRDVELDSHTLWNTVSTQHYWQTEIALHRADGSACVQRLSVSPVLNEHQRPQHFIAVVSDVTSRTVRDTDAATRPLHLYDDTTGLPNHALLLERLSTLIHMAQRQQQRVGVVHIDLMALPSPQYLPSAVTYDTLAQALVEHLSQHLRSTDVLARPQPGQLVVLFPSVKDDQDLQAMQNRLHTVLATPLTVHGASTIVAAQWGYASYPHDGETALGLLHTAQATRQAIAPAATAESRPEASDH